MKKMITMMMAAVLALSMLTGCGRMIETVRNVGYRWEAGYDK